MAIKPIGWLHNKRQIDWEGIAEKKMTEMPIHYLLSVQQMKNQISKPIRFEYLMGTFSCSYSFLISINSICQKGKCATNDSNVIFEESLSLMYRPFSCHTEIWNFAHLSIQRHSFLYCILNSNIWEQKTEMIFRSKEKKRIILICILCSVWRNVPNVFPLEKETKTNI